jgi:hypothetical protein
MEMARGRVFHLYSTNPGKDKLYVTEIITLHSAYELRVHYIQ